MFAPFTVDEVEGIRSVVQLEQQRSEMLLANCTSRPLPQVKSFVRRFKHSLLNSGIPARDIAAAANEQYISILAGARVKKGAAKTLRSTVSMSNLASPLYQSAGSLPLKFRAKYGRPADAPPPEAEGAARRQLTRSKSISDGLARVAPPPPPPPPQIPLIPPLVRPLLRAFRDAGDVRIGGIAALMSGFGGATFVCRVLGAKRILGVPHLLVSFFQPDIKPCYVQPQNLIRLPERLAGACLDLPRTVSVDAILEQLMQTSHFAVSEVPPGVNPLVHKFVQFKSISLAAQLILLEFVANHRIPPAKLATILRSFPQFNPNKFASTEAIRSRCDALIQKIMISTG